MRVGREDHPLADEGLGVRGARVAGRRRRRLLVRRWTASAGRIPARAGSPRACAGRRASSTSRPSPGATRAGAAWRSAISSSTSCTSARSRAEGTFDAAIEHLPGARRARRHRDRGHAGRRVPGRARLGLRRRLPVGRAVELRRARRASQRLVDAAHAAGLAVVLDVVYNHLGASGVKAMEAFGPYFTEKYETFWGKAINYDDAGCDPVREWVLQSAEGWVRDFHVDGLRLDAIHAIYDQGARPVLRELADRVHAVRDGRRRHRRERPERPEGHAPGGAGRLRARRRLGRRLPPRAAHAAHRRPRGLLRGVRERRATWPRPSAARSCTTGSTRRSAGGASARPPTTGRPRSSSSSPRTTTRSATARSATACPREARRAGRVLHAALAVRRPCCSWARSTASARPSSSSPTTSTRSIATATRDGRRREFAAFAAFAGEEVPDPQAPETFERSKLTREGDDPGAARRSTRRLLRAAARAAARATWTTSTSTRTLAGCASHARPLRAGVQLRRGRRRRPGARRRRGRAAPRTTPASTERAACGCPRSPERWCDEPRGLARAARSRSAPTWDGRGHELLAVLRARDARRAVPVRRRRRARSASTSQERTAHNWHCYLPGVGPGPALRLPRRTARTRPREGHRFNPHKLLHRPLRQGDRGRDPLGRGQRAALRARRHATPPTSSSTTRTTPTRCPESSSSTRASTGRATPRRARRGTRRSSTRPTSRASRCATRRCARTCAARTPAWPPTRRSATSSASASPRSSCCRSTTSPTRASCTSRGLSNYWGYSSIGYLAPHADVRGDRLARRAGARVQGHGQGAAPRGHRGDPRRRLQPHRRGQPPRPDAGLQGRRQRELLPAHARRPALLHGLHGHGQLAQRRAPERPAADHGLAALLGRSSATSTASASTWPARWPASCTTSTA